MKRLALISIAIAFVILIGLGAAAPKASAEMLPKQETVELPILMYHRVFDGGHKSRYIITPKQLEDDLIELSKAGYSAVLPSEVINFVNGSGKLPPRPVMLTFDDGHYNNYKYALPLFQKHGFKGVVNVIGKFSQYASTIGDSGIAETSFLTWDQIQRLSQSGLFEIGAHTYNMHNFKPRYGIRRLEGESDEEYFEAFKNDDSRLKKALKDKSGVETNIFAYPFGAFYNDSAQLLSRLGYQVVFTTNAKVNIIKPGGQDTLLSLGRFNRESDWTGDQMLKAITAKQGARLNS